MNKVMLLSLCSLVLARIAPHIPSLYWFSLGGTVWLCVIWATFFMVWIAVTPRDPACTIADRCKG